MDGGPQGSARADAPQFPYFALSVAVFPDGGDSGLAFLAPYLVVDLLFPDIYCHLYLVILAYYFLIGLYMAAIMMEQVLILLRPFALSKALN